MAIEQRQELNGQLQAARVVLRSMPEDIFTTWLDERIAALGWPPQDPRWEGLLRNRSIDYWQSLRWEKTDITLHLGMLDPQSQQLIQQIAAGMQGNTNPLTAFIGNSGERARSIYRYLKQTGKLPSRIILLREDGRLLVVDGFHRLTVLFIAQANRDHVPLLSDVQSAWIGSH